MAAEAPPVTRDRELVERRTATGKVFELSDGRMEAEIAPDPVHYRDGEGRWQEIDTRVAATDREGFGFGNTRNGFGSFFGTRSDRLVRFEVGQRHLAVGLAGAARDLSPQVDGDTVTYRDVFDTADLVYQVTGEGLKEEIVLEEVPDEPTFSFVVQMGGVIARVQEDGSIAFLRTGGEGPPLFEIPKPFMFDDADDPMSPYGKSWSDQVTQTVEQQGSRIEITVRADADWLASEDRRYPVVIDPTIIIEPTPTQGQDAMIRSAAGSTNYGASWQLGVGTDATAVARSLVKFDVSWLPAGTPITSAQLRMWYDQGYYTNANAVAIGAHRVTAPWSESTVTWSNFTGGAGEQVATVTKAALTNSVWHSFAVGGLVQQWVDGTRANYGFMLRAVDEATKGKGGAYYEAAEYAYNGGTANRPKLVLTYGRPGVTLSPITTMFATGAQLSWGAYVDPSTASGDDLVEYQVHRTVYQRFTPSASTLVAPVAPGTTTFTDTTAEPTPADSTEPLGNAYYYMVAVKTKDGSIVPASTQLARLPKAGQVTKIIQGSALDTTLSSAQPSTNYDVFDGEPWLGAGDNGGSYGRTRTVVKFPDLATAVPTGSKITNADLNLWKPLTFGSGATFDLHALTRDFSETTATWNRASSTTAWTTPGGDYSPTVVDYVPTMTTDSKWHVWYVDSLVQQWVNTPSSNKGALIKIRNETIKNQLSVFASSELASEPLLRPRLEVTFLQKTTENTYYAPDTPGRSAAGEQRTIPVTITNTTATTWTTANHVLSYHWAKPDGTDVTTSTNRLETALPANLAPGQSVTLNAAVRSPELLDPSNKREAFTLQWDMRDRTSGQWISQSENIPALDQSAMVENPTSNQLGLERFYQYTGKNTGAGSTVMANLFAGNTVFSYNAFANPSRGVSTFVRMTYNSLDTSASAMGYGWSLSTSSVMRMGTPLDLHPRGQAWPTQVTLTDGDGTAHLFSLNKHGSTNEADWTYDSPAGVHLYLQKTGVADPTRAWVMTSPDRTRFFFDTDGYQSALADRNGNELLFTYEERKSNNKPIKFLRYLTDPAGRQTLTLDYYTKGQAYTWVDDAGAKQSGTNLTNPKIIDQVESIVDISGRKVTFVYTDKGLMAEMVDGAGQPQAKTFRFVYDADETNKNTKLVKVTDPRGNATELAYFEATQDPKAKWMLSALTERAGGVTGFAYVDPDGAGGSQVQTTVTDAKNNATVYLMDGYGRPLRSTNAKNETTQLSWDDDHNVTQLTEANAAKTTWTYDTNTGYPTSIKDAEANANGTAATTLSYRTSLDGHVAELTEKLSPEGRKWSFGYDTVGNLTSVTDPAGTATATAGDYTTTYTYDARGQLLTATDANGNVTTHAGYGPTGYPTTITDALTHTTTFGYDVRGNVTTVTDAKGKTSTYGYDLFGRPTESQVPKDQAAGVFIVTPAPVYDPNDNITKATAPNGAATTYGYDKADQMTSTTLPVDKAGDPARTTAYAYDLVGNLTAQTEPKGTLTTGNPDDFVTRYAYDPVDQLTSVTNADGQRITYRYDNVGNVTAVIDPRKNATADPDDVTTSYLYDRNHRATTVTDAAGKAEATEYDLDGLVTEVTDKEGNTTLVSHDPRGLVREVKVPHAENGGSITYRTTQYGYDQVGNLTKVSAPPSAGQSVRNDTTYAHFDNGWVKTSTDAWDIATSYDYNALGQQTLRTLTSGGGSSARSMSWSYFPDGKLAGRGDSGVPAGAHVVLVDNSDTPNVATTGTWATGTAGSGYQGYDYRTHPAGGTDKLTWTLHIPADGNYQVFARYPGGVTGAATSASYTVTHTAGSTAKSVNQSQGGGQWVSLGSFAFTEDGTHSVSLAAASTGTVLADAVKLVRDTTGQTDAEAKDFTYTYDPNGNLVEVTDTSSGADVDRYAIGYTGLNQVASVAESDGGVVDKTTTFSYDPNGNPLTRGHNDQYASYAYDMRDLVSRVSNGESASDPDPKVTTYSYTARGQKLTEVKANGNTVDYGYHLDGLLARQVETKANGTVVAEHTIGYDLNGNRVTDVARTMNADNHTAYQDRTHTYTFDPRDRIATVVKTDTSSGSTLATETYLHDAANNVISQTLQGVTTTFGYDRNRLLTATTGGQTAAYNYDPFGRLDTVTAAGTVLERYRYDGFDRITEHTKTTDTGGSETTAYSYDPLDRTTSRTDTDGETTTFAYLGLSGEVLSEEVAGVVQKSYQYSPWGQRLSQIKHNGDGTEEEGFYGYNPHTDVEVLTDQAGDTTATYGYTAYGSDDTAEFTGADKPNPQEPGAEPYNVYRYNAKRWDPASGNYDMGFRDYSPGLNRFLSRDLYTGALTDLNLSASPWNNNRYAFAGGNPITGIELDGHRITECDGPCAPGNPGQWENPVTGQIQGTHWTPDDSLVSGYASGFPRQTPPKGPYPASECCDRNPTLPFVWNYRSIIWNVASDEELDPYLLAVLLLQEGEDRMAFADNPLTGILFRTLEVGAGTIKNDSIGIAQMQPDTARRRMGATSTSRWDAAVLLAYNDEAAIRLAASHLKYLQTKFQLTNMQTYVAYAGSEGDAIPAYLSGGPADRALYPRMFAREAGYNVQFERVSGMFLGFGVVE